MSHKCKLAILASTVILVAACWGGYVFLQASDIAYSFAEPAIFDALVSSDGTRLYITHPIENAVIEIDTTGQDLQEIRRFSVIHPVDLAFSPSGTHLYSTIRGDQGGIARIELATGSVENLMLIGDVPHFVVDHDPSAHRLWAIERLWPNEGDYLDEFPPANSGRLTLVSTDGGLSVVNSVEIQAVPNSIYYPPISNRLYVKHNLWIATFPPSPPGVLSGEPPETMGQLITIYDADSLALLNEIEAGKDHDTARYAELSLWDVTGRYMMVPACVHPTPSYSFRVIDTLDDSIELELSLPLHGAYPGTAGYAAGLRHAHLVPGENVLWASVFVGQLSPTDSRKLMVRIDTTTQEFDFYPVDEATDFLGDFAIAPDGNTLYLTVVPTGELIEWHPYNQPPICEFTATPNPYVGPAPAVIQFDASASYDPDGEIVSYEWAFGDGAYGEGVYSTHDYYESGLYTVTLTVTDNDGAESVCDEVVDITIT